MIRIYLDWSVISCLKRDEYAELLEFIKSNKERLLFPYTPAHFNDLMKSYSPDNELFYKDLDQLEWLAGNHMLDWINDEWVTPVKSPKEYFKEREQDNSRATLEMIQQLQQDAENDEPGMWNFGKLIKMISEKKPSGITINDENREALNILFPGIHNNSSQWDLMKAVVPFVQKLQSDKDFYKDFKRSINNHGLKLTSDSGSWNPEEVFQNIDAFFKSMGSDLTFKKYVEMTVAFSKKDKATIYDYFTTAYMLLDLIGYKKEKLSKDNNNIQNIRTDVEHAFYASTCNYFVVMDKVLAIKTKVLYSEFGIPTGVITPAELIDILNGRFHTSDKNCSFINEALEMLTEETMTEKYMKDSDAGIEVDTYVHKLPVFYFDFFTHVNVLNCLDKKVLLLEYNRPYFFDFHTEIKRMTHHILSFLGYQEKPELETIIDDFVYQRKEQSFQWKYDFGLVELIRDLESGEAKLIYTIKGGSYYLFLTEKLIF